MTLAAADARACRRARRALFSARELEARSVPPAVRAHLARCAECAAIAARREVVLDRLAEPAARVSADPAFAAGVLCRLPGSTEALGRAALRLLPGAVALLIALSWLGMNGPRDGRFAFEPIDASALLAYAALDDDPRDDGAADGGLDAER